MDVLGFGNEAEHLRSSLQKGMLRATDMGNDRYSMGMNFNLYGRFADMGVGRDVSSNVVNLEINPETGGLRTVRRPKEWFSGYWWAQLQRLKEIMKKNYASLSTSTIIDELSNFMGNARTTRGFRYAVQQSKRNARNYTRRRSMPGKWTNNHKTWKPNSYK